MRVIWQRCARAETAAGCGIRCAAQREVASAEQALTPAEDAVSQTLARDPQLAGRIVTEVRIISVVGEGSNALLGYLLIVSRLLDTPLAILI